MKPTMTIEPGAHLAAAMYLIRHSHDPALVVMRCDNQVPLGTLGYSEIAKAIADGRDPESCLVREVARASRATTDVDTDTDTAARVMVERGLERLPVMEVAHLAGVVELADCRHE